MSTLSILHLTDTHLLAKGLHSSVVDPGEALLRALRSLVPVDALDLLVISGDISDDGSLESYRRVQELASDYAAHRGAQVLYAMGNHDNRPVSGQFWAMAIREH